VPRQPSLDGVLTDLARGIDDGVGETVLEWDICWDRLADRFRGRSAEFC
jgi:hypothetical protein